MNIPSSVPKVPPPIRADSYFKRIQPTRSSDPTLSKATAAVLTDPEVTIALSHVDGWDLRQPEVFAALPADTTRLSLAGKVDLRWLTRCRKLERLSLPSGVSNWEALAELPELRVLSLDLVQIPDLSFLGASRLEVLNLHNVRLQTLAHLDRLTCLRQIEMHVKVKDADSWRSLSSLTQLQRVDVQTYSPVAIPDLGNFPELRYLAVSAPDIGFQPDSLVAAPALEALALDAAPFEFMASPQGVRPGAREQWIATLRAHMSRPLRQHSTTLKRVYFGELTAEQRRTLADWLQIPCVRTPEQLFKKHYVPTYDDRAEARAEKAYTAAVRTIQKRVQQIVGKRCAVHFSAYELDAHGRPLDNLDHVSFEGPCRIEHGDDERNDLFRSAVLHSPTWLDMVQLAHQMILSTNPTTDHRFLEGIEVIGTSPQGTLLRFVMGS